MQEFFDRLGGAGAALVEVPTHRGFIALGIVVVIVGLGILVDRLFISKRMLRIRTVRLHLGLALARATRKTILPVSLVAGILIALAWLKIDDPLVNGLRTFLELTITIQVTVFIARLSTALLHQISRDHEEGSGKLASSAILITLGRILIYAIGTVVMLGQLNIEIAPIITALGVGGLAMALALQSTLTNFFTGLQLLASRRIRVGDFIRLENGTEGTVVNVDWRSTIIQQTSNNMIVVPNLKLADAVVVNTSLSGQTLSLLVAVGVAYGSDLDKVEAACVEIGREVMELPGGDPSFEPVVRFHTLGDFSINANVVLKCKVHTDQYLLRHEFIKRIVKRFAQEGIEIPLPTRVVIEKVQTT